MSTNLKHAAVILAEHSRPGCQLVPVVQCEFQEISAPVFIVLTTSVIPAAATTPVNVKDAVTWQQRHR